MGFENGKIYRIISKETDQIYIGSTVEPLRVRLSKHNHDLKRYQRGNFHYICSFDICKYEDARILLVEEYPCASTVELLAREQWWMDRICRKYGPDKIVNTHMAHTGMTRNEYVIAYRTKRHNCICGVSHDLSNKSRHTQSKRHINFIKNNTHSCDCGQRILNTDEAIRDHCKHGRRHLAYELEIITETFKQ